MPDPIEWVAMTFDPKLRVDPHFLIRVMKGQVSTLTADQWEDAKECCADVMEQFLALREERECRADTIEQSVVMREERD